MKSTGPDVTTPRQFAIGVVIYLSFALTKMLQGEGTEKVHSASVLHKLLSVIAMDLQDSDPSLTAALKDCLEALEKVIEAPTSRHWLFMLDKYNDQVLTEFYLWRERENNPNRDLVVPVRAGRARQPKSR